MNGVEILNQTSVYKTDGIAEVFFLSLGVCFLVGLILAIIEWRVCGFDIVGFCILGVSIMFGTLAGGFLFIGTIHETDELDHVKYQVTVSDQVNLNEFLDKYEILDQEGKIYTIKERE